MDEDIKIDDVDVTPVEDGSTLYTVESAIKEHIRRLDELKDKQRKLNEMLTSYLENDDEYREVTKAAKDAGAKKSAVKQHLLSDPAAKDLPMRVDELKDEKKELAEALSYYLAEYQRLSGTNELEIEGELKQIVYSARLVKRSGGN